MTKKEAIEKMRKPWPGDQCLLCGSVPDVIGIFTPENSQDFGGSKNKDRVIRYCLCNRCFKKTDAPEQVEKALKIELLGVTHAIS